MIEIFCVSDAGAGLVMVSPDKRSAQLSAARHYLIRTGPITNNVAQIEDAVIAPRRPRRRQARVQRFQVSMNVTDDQNPQSLPLSS